MGFHLRNRGLGTDDLTRWGMEQGIIDLVGIQLYVVLKIILQPLSHVFVIIDCDMLLFQVSRYFWGELHIINIKGCCIRTNKEIGHKDRIAVDIRPPQVQRPCDIIKCCDQDTISMVLPKCLTNTRQFTLSRFPSIFQRLQFYLIQWNDGTILPNESKRVKIGPDCYASRLSQLLDHIFHKSIGADHSIHSHFRALDAIKFLC